MTAAATTSCRQACRAVHRSSRRAVRRRASTSCPSVPTASTPWCAASSCSPPSLVAAVAIARLPEVVAITVAAAVLWDDARGGARGGRLRRSRGRAGGRRPRRCCRARVSTALSRPARTAAWLSRWGLWSPMRLTGMEPPTQGPRLRARGSSPCRHCRTRSARQTPRQRPPEPVWKCACRLSLARVALTNAASVVPTRCAATMSISLKSDGLDSEVRVSPTGWRTSRP